MVLRVVYRSSVTCSIHGRVGFGSSRTIVVDSRNPNSLCFLPQRVKQFSAQYFEIKLGNLYSIVIFYCDVSSSILFTFVEHVQSYWINFFGTFSSDELGTFTARYFYQSISSKKKNHLLVPVR